MLSPIAYNAAYVLFLDQQRKGQKMTNQQIYSTGAIAQQIQLPRWRLIYLIDSGTLPEPSIQIPGRRIFTGEDLWRIQEILQARPELTVKRARSTAVSPATTG